MEKQIYEKPSLGFENLKLSERIADTCFGNGNGGLDTVTYYTEDGQEVVIDITQEGNNGCGGSHAADTINDALAENGIDASVNPSVNNTRDSSFSAPANTGS